MIFTFIFNIAKLLAIYIAGKKTGYFLIHTDGRTDKWTNGWTYVERCCTSSLRMILCLHVLRVCVCVRAREREGKREKERERARERGRGDFREDS